MSQAVGGARAIFTVNDVSVATASNCTYEWRHEVHPIETVDNVEIAEHAETGVRVEFSCDTFRVATKSMTNVGIQPKLINLLTQPELIVKIEDKITNAPLLVLTRVKFTGRSGRVNARGVWTETITFSAITAYDEGSLP